MVARTVVDTFRDEVQLYLVNMFNSPVTLVKGWPVAELFELDVLKKVAEVPENSSLAMAGWEKGNQLMDF